MFLQEQKGKVLMKGGNYMNCLEIKKCIEYLTSDDMYFVSFDWHSLNDRGNACSGRLDQYDNEEELKNFETLRNLVCEAMPKGSLLYGDCAERMSMYFGRNFVHYNYCAKLVARALDGISSLDELKAMVYQSLRFRYEKTREALHRGY